EQATFSQLNLPSRGVMESAGRACADLIAECYLDELKKTVFVFAGSGNNGGDGYVIARVLKQRMVDVDGVSLSPAEKVTADSAQNIEAFRSISGEIRFVDQSNWQDVIASCELGKAGVFVDALFGTGFHGELRGFVQSLCAAINELSLKNDIPIF